MPGEWKEVIRLRFKGQRFDGHALDLGALTELRHFQTLIAETAKALWRAANPNRERLPAHFEERTRLCLRTIEDGSATTPLEVYVKEPERPELFDSEPFDDLTSAAQLACDVYSATEGEAELPEKLPRELVMDYAKLGETLEANETLEIRLPQEHRWTRISRTTRERLARRLDRPYEDQIEVTGEVIEADVRHCRFQICLPAGSTVSVAFTEAQESNVTTALRDHRAVQLVVRGRGEYSPGGRLHRILHVDDLQIVQREQAAFDSSARSIEDVLSELAAQVPAEEWNALPSDLTDQLDHYIYGTSKE
jgi:hypothetical protein